MISARQKLLAGTWKENSQIFYEDFYLPLYLPHGIYKANIRDGGKSVYIVIQYQTPETVFLNF
jgi:hypothetical protein